MELAKVLEQQYGVNRPLIFNDIKTAARSYAKRNYSESSIRQFIKKSVDRGELKRAEDVEAIYFVPRENVLGRTVLSPSRIAYKKYINDGENVIGIYSGWSFLNMIGATTQVPIVTEIVTNEESMNSRDMTIGLSKFILRKPRYPVNSENEKTLAILEIASRVALNEQATRAVLAYALENKVTFKDILRYIGYYPDRTFKNMKGVADGLT